MIVEMTIVNPPCILDFAKCKIDRPPDFSEEVLRDCEEKGRFEFGRNWRHVKAILQTLENYQILLSRSATGQHHVRERGRRRMKFAGNRPNHSLDRASFLR